MGIDSTRAFDSQPSGVALRFCPVNTPGMNSITAAQVPSTSFNISRRRFLQSGSALAALAAFPSLGADVLDLVSGKPKRVGLIGAGWYGKSDLWRLLQVAPVEVVSICDVDQHQLAGAVGMAAQRQKSGKSPRGYTDFREMLKERDLDIVLVGSPDHWHALLAIAAMESGADVYCQKPISADVAEGEAMLDAARRLKRVVQIGTQRRSTPHWIEAKKQIVDAGLLGKIGLVEMCCYYQMRSNENRPVQPVPDFIDYDMWTGPAPLRPYKGLPHRGWWRGFMEYGNGILGDMCVHMLMAPDGCWIWAGPIASVLPAAFTCRRKVSQISQIRRRLFSNTTDSTPYGNIARGATRRIRVIPGRFSSMATRARSK
jgi:hypothetical protein